MANVTRRYLIVRKSVKEEKLQQYTEVSLTVLGLQAREWYWNLLQARLARHNQKMEKATLGFPRTAIMNLVQL